MWIVMLQAQSKNPTVETVCYGPYWLQSDADKAAREYVGLGWLASIHKVQECHFASAEAEHGREK